MTRLEKFVVAKKASMQQKKDGIIEYLSVVEIAVDRKREVEPTRMLRDRRLTFACLTKRRNTAKYVN